MYWRVIKGTARHISQKNTALVSAGVAFFLMLSLFPALAAFIALLGLVLDPSIVLPQLEAVREILPDDVFDIVNRQIQTLIGARSDTLGWASALSLLAALWSARAGVSALMTGLNDVYGSENRSALHHYMRALVLTVLLVLVGIVALATMVVAPVVLAFFSLGLFGTFAVEAFRWAIMVFVLFASTGLLYRFGANRPGAAFEWATPGAFVAIALWIVASIGFSYYVANFGNYNEVYGSIGAVIAMLVWLWLCAFLVLFGAALNVQMATVRKGGDLPDPLGDSTQQI